MNINEIAQYIKDHYDLRNEELTVVFPNKRAALYLRKQFTKVYDGTIWMPQMLSIEEAVSKWSGIVLADTVDLLFELIAIDTGLGHHGSSLTTFGSMAVQMAKDFDEIDQNAVDANHLFSYIYEEKKIGSWHLGEEISLREQAYLDFFRRLKNYYDQLRQRLSDQGKGYYGMITRKLAETDAERLREMTQNQRIIFAGFNALTPTEQTIIDTLYKNRQAEVLWDFDRYYVEDPNNEAGFFARQYLKKDVLWKPKTFSDQLLTEKKEIHIVEVTGNTIQAKALQSLLETNPDPDTAVILADENLLIPVMNSIPDNGRYPSISVSMGYPMRHTAMNNLVSEFFTLHRKGRKVDHRGWYLWPVLRILDLEVVKVIFNQEELNQIREYQNMVREKAWFIYEEQAFNTICTSADLQRFMKMILGNGEKEDSFVLLDSLIELLKFVAYKIQTNPTANDFLLNQVSETGKVVNRLKNILSRYQHYVRGIDELEVLFQLINHNIAIKLNGKTTEGLQLMGILETRNLDFDNFYMIGVNEGILPTDKSNGSFIPYPIRKECGLPDYKEKQAVYAYHFYRLLQHAQKMYFIYNTNSNESGSEPSRFLMQLEYELAKQNPAIKLTHESFVNKTVPEDMPSELFAVKNIEALTTLSPTSLSSYISCPLKFYLRFIENIKDERLEEEAQENDIGSVIHKTLEDLYKPYLNTVIHPEFFAQAIKPMVPEKLDQAIKAYYGQGLSNVGYNYLNKLSIDSLLNRYVKYEENCLKDHELSIVDVERNLYTDIEVNGHLFHLKGKADRIDCCDGLTRIIDYKTGTVKNEHVKVPKDVNSLKELPEKALQLLIYKYLYLKEHPEKRPETVTAAIFGLRYEQLVFDLKVEDQSLNDRFMETMERLLTELLEELMDSTIPYRQTEEEKKKLCRYCDYKGLCVNTSKGALQEDDH